MDKCIFTYDKARLSYLYKEHRKGCEEDKTLRLVKSIIEKFYSLNIAEGFLFEGFKKIN